MPKVPIVMPQLGESIAEATITRFLVEAGVGVAAGQDLIEVETNKAVMSVTAPCNGRLAGYRVGLNQDYVVGEVLGYIEASVETAAELGIKPPGPGDGTGRAEEIEAPQTSLGSPENAAGGASGVKPTVQGLPVPAHLVGAEYMSPRMKARMEELGLRQADLAGVAGTGAGGRVTIQDFERFLARLEQSRLTEASPMRVSVADAMRRSWSRPLATVGLSLCLDPMLRHRKTLKPMPGPALYALRAVALALRENSAPAGRLIGSKIVHPTSIDVGFAVEAEDGVLVPVIREADRHSLTEITPRYNELIKLARSRRLPLEAYGQSIVTVTNFGTFGLTWATPVPLPEQTLVLGMGAGRKMPHWDEERQQFVPVTEACLTLSFDHRVLDGGAAGRLLSRVKDLMSHPADL